MRFRYHLLETVIRRWWTHRLREEEDESGNSPVLIRQNQSQPSTSSIWNGNVLATALIITTYAIIIHLIK